MVIQIEEWIDNPKNSLSKQEISTNMISIKVRNFTTFEILKVEGLNDPIQISLKRRFGNKTDNDTCLFWNEEKSIWETTGIDMISNSDTAINCLTSHLTSFGAGE